MDLLRGHWAEVVLSVVGAAALCVLTGQHLPAFPSPEPSFNHQPLSFWVAQMDGPDRAQAEAAVRAIGPKGVPFLLRAMWEGQRVRLGPHLALRALGPCAVPQLIKALDDPQEKVRLAAIRQLTVLAPRLDRQVQPVALKVTRLLGDPVSDIRLEAELFLDRVGPSRVCAVSALIANLEFCLVEPDENSLPIQQVAIHALAQCGAQAKSAVPILVNLLANDREAATRHQAALAIWQITRDPNVVVPMLSEMLCAKDINLRRMAAGALLRIGREAGVSDRLLAEAERLRREMSPPPIRAAGPQLGRSTFAEESGPSTFRR